MTEKIGRDFYLLLDASIICSYLATDWVAMFKQSAHFRGILIPTAKISDEVLEQRQAFHDQYSSCEEITPKLMEDCLKVYPDMDETEEAMLRSFGVAAQSATNFRDTFFIGPKANSPETRTWLESKSQNGPPPAVFVCATKILKPWWIEVTDHNLFNIHSAVLPFARGMHAIENIALKRDVEQFKRAAGFTIHYIDEGVDTGAVIKSQRLRNALGFESIWELKGHLYKWEGEHYVQFAKEFLSDTNTKPAGIIMSTTAMGENYRIRDFTPEKSNEAELSYKWMKSQYM